MTKIDFIMRRSRTADAESIAGLMSRAFGGDGAAPFDAAWWHWKYAANPAGYQGLVAQDSGGRLVGHFGGMPLEVCVEGEPLTFAQSCDTCTDPAVRRGLAKPGLFARLAQAYTSTYGVPDANAVMFGFPNRRAYRIGSRYSDYWMLRQQWLLVAEGPSAPAGGTVVEDVTSFDEGVSELFDRLQNSYRCVARRDARFLRWRFVDAPASPYCITQVRTASDGTLRGYAVHRSARLMENDVGLLVDWFCDPDDEAAAQSLQAAVRERYIRLGRSALVFLCPTASSWFGAFQRWGFRVRPSPYMMTARPFVSELEPRYLREHWYYTLADFDVF